MNPVSEKELLRLLSYYGGKKVRLAEKLGVSQPYISKYLKLGGLPAIMAIRVERMTGGDFKAVDICFE
jgi:predicted transcriptional regulator